MNTCPIVSVVMTTYNNGKYLKEAINSILNQTFSEFEFIIINDGSTDNSQYIIDSYKDNRIISLKHKTRLGVPKSRNKGMKVAQGEYIAVMDADDISLPNRLELQVKFLDENSHIGLLGSYYFIIDGAGNFLKSVKPVLTNNELQTKLMEGNPIAHGSIMFRKECLNTIGGYREKFRYSHDYDLILRIAEHFQIANIPELLYKYRINPLGISVVTKVPQESEGPLIKHLAIERRKYGKEQSNMISWIEMNRNLIQSYYRWGKYLYCKGSYRSALKSFLRSLPYSLFNIDLIVKTVIKLIIPKKILLYLMSHQKKI
ncbi:MAG: glycosyltransferase [Candidatus Stahlbacteria bacterium]|nr:glycosyltransferase [Candidatus Stahlbacteria bacterium]